MDKTHVITHVITLDTNIIGWIAMENRTNDINITKYIIPNSRPRVT